MSQPRSSAIRLLLAAGVPSLVFVATFAFRWLSMGALENDHFVALARAHQILHGDWPVRDFTDPGQPLAYLTSAAAARLFGPTLLTDVALSIAVLSLAAALTYRLALRASGSLLIATVAVAVELAAMPRLYNAGKVLIPLAAVGLGWRYADAPSLTRLVALAAWTAIAGLWRHDYAVYIAAPTLGLLALCHDRREAMRAASLYVAAVLAFLLPWLIYVQWAVGLVEYLGTAVRFAAAEGQRTVGWSVGSLPTLVAITAIPLLAIALARRSHERLSFAHIAFAASMALIANFVLLRDVIATRMPDVIGLTAVLAAWLAGRLVPRPMRHAVASIALVIVGAAVVMRLGSQGFGVPTPAQAARRFAAVSTMLRTEAPEVIPNRERWPLIRYLASCTPERSRVLVSGFGPEIAVLAGRPFAAGLPTWIPGYSTHPRDEERAVARLAREPVSIAVMLEGSTAFTDGWPRLAAALRARNFVERTWRLNDTDVVVWIPQELAARSPGAPPTCTTPNARAG